MLNKFCCVSFKDEGKNRGNTKLCANVNGKERLYCGFIVGFSPSHWDMCDAQTLDDADNIGQLYASRGCKLLKGKDKGKDILEIDLQVGLYRVVYCDGTCGDFTAEEVRDGVNRMNRMVDGDNVGSELIAWYGSDKVHCGGKASRDPKMKEKLFSHIRSTTRLTS